MGPAAFFRCPTGGGAHWGRAFRRIGKTGGTARFKFPGPLHGRTVFPLVFDFGQSFAKERDNKLAYMEQGELVMKRAACLMIFLMLSATTSRAQEPEVARNTCSECHATQKGQLLSPNLRAPTWVEIANTPGVTAAALLVMLTTPHAGMPMFLLTPEQRQQIIDYILSLKSRN
jgi:hypothetical protein